MLTKPSPFPYKLMEKYPGMRPRDEVIWDAYVHKNPDIFKRVWYNVGLGDPFPEEESKQEAIASGAYEVSQWRIDVLAETETAFICFELKPMAGAGAIGQTLAYSKMVAIEWNLEKPVIPVVLTDKISPILQQAGELLGVGITTP